MAKAQVRLVLASASPRRLQLLERVGLVPDLLNPTDVDETPLKRETPRALSIRLARTKAERALEMPLVRSQGTNAFVLAADTVVGLGRRILPKAETEAEARTCLGRLSGRRHRVLGAVAVGFPDGMVRTRLVETVVRFKRLEAAEVDDYLQSGEWRGKAGGSAIQGRAARFVDFISGSYSNVVGLPLFETVKLLKPVVS